MFLEKIAQLIESVVSGDCRQGAIVDANSEAVI